MENSHLIVCHVALMQLFIFGGALPSPDLLYRISTIRSAEKYLHNNYLKSPPKKVPLLTLITLNSAFKHISFIHYDGYK